MKRRILCAVALSVLISAAGLLGGCPSNSANGASAGDAVLTDTGSGGDTGGGTDSGGTDTAVGADSTAAADAGDAATDTFVDPGKARWLRPSGTAVVSFWVDDSANQTYADGDIQWTGSYKWSDKDNTLAYSSNWLPENGPYPLLYDDGPIAEGGHEMMGATAGDHVFSTEVYFKATEDTVFEYGALNEFGNWIWVGPNGLVEVPTGSTERYSLEGMTIKPFGDINMKVTLDTAALHPEFAATPPAKVFLKGTMNSWTPVQVLDDGQGGDEKAGDGIFTYIHLDKLGPHDGGLRLGQEAQFVFVFTLSEEALAEDGLEYKVDDNAVKDGVAAYSDWETKGTWTDEELLVSLDSKGKSLNTAIMVGDDENLPTGCTSDAECPGQKCDLASGECVSAVCTSDADCPGQKCDLGTGNCVTAGCTSDSDCPGQKCDTGTGECIPASCTSDAECPGQKCDLASGECVDKPPPGDDPVILLITPDSGSAVGGTMVTIDGQSFQDGATVSFGGAAATGVTFTSADKITCSTPPHAAGSVNVTIDNPDGGTNTFPNGFEYLDESAAPTISNVTPSSGSVKGGTMVSVEGANFGSNAILTFGGKAATETSVNGSGEITAKTPTHEAGSVDVKVTNNDGQSATLAGGFEYVPELPDWVGLTESFAVSSFAGEQTALLKGQVYEAGITEAPGEGGGMKVEVGYGPTGSDPYAKVSGWTWKAATYQADAENNDVYGGAVTVATAGSYDWAMRFSVNNGETWLVADTDGANSPGEYSAAKAGKLTVKAFPTDPTVLSMSPGVVSVLGGTKLVLTGFKLSGAVSVLVDGEEVAPSLVTDAKIEATVPAHAAGQVDVAVDLGSSTIPAPGLLRYCPLFTPVLDGAAGAGEYDPALLLAENTVASTWSDAGSGVYNELSKLYASYDSENLYLTVVGQVHTSGGNSIVAYLDRDSGGATGTAKMWELTDTTGALDASIEGGLQVSVPGFGAEFAAGTVEMKSANGELSDFAGWRGLYSPENLAWVEGDVVAGASGADGAVEMAVPLATLFPAGIPANGATIAVVVRVTYYGDKYANQSLPMGIAGATNTEQTAVAELTVFAP